MKKFFVIMLILAVIIVSGIFFFSKPKLPTEIQIGDVTVNLGITEIGDLLEAGFSLVNVGQIGTAREGQEYLPFYTDFTKDGQNFRMDLYTPWSGRTYVQKEFDQVLIDGIVGSMSFRLSDLESGYVFYNGVDVTDITPEMLESWGRTPQPNSGTLSLITSEIRVDYMSVTVGGGYYVVISMPTDAFPKR